MRRIFSFFKVGRWILLSQIKDFDITQIPSNDGKNFPTLHKVIHQVKSWIRGIYSWVSEFNIDRYLAEYSFRINRSQSKDTIFNKLMKRIVERSPVSQSQLVCRIDTSILKYSDGKDLLFYFSVFIVVFLQQ